MKGVVEKSFNELFSRLQDRDRDVLMGRFGIGDSGERRTLASLGDKYGVTRERIRQIEEGTLENLRRTMPESDFIRDVLEHGQKKLKQLGGVAAQKDLVDHYQSRFEGITHSHLLLIFEVSGSPGFYSEDKNFHPFYYSGDESFVRAKNFIDEWADFIKRKKEEILEKFRYFECLETFVRQQKINRALAENYLKISKKIHTNVFGDVGLADWPEIKPTTIRSKIYLVLKKKARPLHFEEIARLINESNLGARKALVPTVHNELIKDGRFVLVGRGVYALREHGYEPGTSKEVIQRILKKNGSMKSREIVLAVQKERFFKPTTILINLQNKKFFERLSDGTYRLKK